MTAATLLAIFVVLFSLFVVAGITALKFWDAQRKKQVVDMLHTASGETVVTISNLLKEFDPESQRGFKQFLTTLHFSRHLQEQIQQAGLNWPVSRLLAIMVALGGAGLFIGVTFPFLLDAAVTAIAMAAVLAWSPYLVVRHKRKKRLAALEEQFPEALDFMSRSMRAGHAFSISLEMLGEEMVDPLGQEFRALFNEQNLGAQLDTALRNFAVRVPLLDVRFFTSSVLLQKQTGGNLSEILTRLAYVIRERFRLKNQVKAASAHGRLTATVLTVLPVITMLLLLVIAPGYLEGMASDPDGKWLIFGAIAGQIIGSVWIRKIINIKV